MLAELILHATARSEPEARRLGLVGDAVALWSRATRCRGTWAPHQRRCESAVEQAIAPLPRAGTTLVLGSGLGREIALPALTRHFDRVVLVDAVHLWPARRLARRNGAVLARADLTGCVDWLFGHAAGRLDPLAAFRAEPPAFVLSANLLSQMPMAPERWAERHPAAAARLPADLPRRIVDWHLADLASLGAPACLLTDIRHRRIGRDGAVLDETDLLQGAALPEPDDAWDWVVAPPGEIERRVAHVHRVHAFHDLGRSTALTPRGASATGGP